MVYIRFGGLSPSKSRPCALCFACCLLVKGQSVKTGLPISKTILCSHAAAKFCFFVEGVMGNSCGNWLLHGMIMAEAARSSQLQCLASCCYGQVNGITNV